MTGDADPGGAVEDLDADDPAVRRRAARTLFDLARESPDSLDASTRARMVECRHDDAVRPLLHGALFELAPTDRQESAGVLEDLGSDDDARRRVAAATWARRRAAMHNGEEREVDALIDCVTDHTASAGARSQAARALSYRDVRANYRARPTGIVSALVELVDVGTVDGRGAAAKLLAETVFASPDAVDGDAREAALEAVGEAVADDDYRVRLRAIAPFCEYRPYEDLGIDPTPVAEPIAAARDDDHPRVAERAREAWSRVPLDEEDLDSPAASAGGPRSDADLKERVKALDDDDPEELAADASTIVAGLSDRDASNFAAGRAASLALADPGALLDEEGAVAALSDLADDGYWGQEDAAVALGALIVHDPSVADHETAMRALRRLGYVGSYAGGRLPGRAWRALGVASGADGADTDAGSLRRVGAYVDSLEVDPVDFLVDCWREEQGAIETLAADVRARVGDADGEAARAAIELGELDPSLWGDALPAALRATADCDAEDRASLLETVRSVAETDPGLVADAVEECLDLVLDPDPSLREPAAWVCWHVGRHAETTGGSVPDGVAALAAHDEDAADRQPFWPAGALAREDPDRVRSALVRAVEDRLDERSDRTAGQRLGEFVAEVHGGDPAVGRPAVRRLLATVDDEAYTGGISGSVRADVSAALAAVADRYADEVVEEVDGIAEFALSANWSSERGMRNAVLVLDALVEENHDDAVYEALREHVSRGGDPERGAHEGYLTRHGYFAEESERMGELFFDAVLAERAAARERLEIGARGLLKLASTEDVANLSDRQARALVPEMVGRLRESRGEGDGKLESLAGARPGVVAAHVEDVGDLLGEYWVGPRTVGATVARILATEDPASVGPIATELAERVADEDDEYVFRASVDALRRLAGEDPDSVAAALDDRFDHYDTDADAPADVLDRCRSFEDNRDGLERFLPGVGDRSTRRLAVECFRAAGVDPNRTAE